ncbi:MAG: type I phosphomannose isomerase catalytic subunit [Bacilli bacterium]|nr:type I phosphomannose isomerase catalytic subunit [Bacilli bacterium]
MEKDQVLFLSGPLKERIWGGTYFKDVLKITQSEEPIGELWSCSGHEEGESIILNDTYKGKKLSEVFLNHKELFNNSKLNDFPILIKLIATSDKLSVQVHPNDEYARINENQYGKTEGWLILDEKEDSSLVIGHNATNKEELITYIQNDDYSHLLNEIKVNKGDFYPIPSGTIHALGKNLVLLEIQQSSDVTYRFYDYHRKDKNGNERPLHVQKALDVTSFEKYDFNINNIDDLKTPILWLNQYFEVYYYNIDKYLDLVKGNEYLICSVIEGSLKVLGEEMTLGKSFILTSNCKNIRIKGKGKLIVTKSLM